MGDSNTGKYFGTKVGSAEGDGVLSRFEEERGESPYMALKIAC